LLTNKVLAAFQLELYTYQLEFAKPRPIVTVKKLMFANVPRGAFKSTLPFEYGTLIFSPRQVRSEQKE
jgi:hypothetical protein